MLYRITHPSVLVIVMGFDTYEYSSVFGIKMVRVAVEVWKQTSVIVD